MLSRRSFHRCWVCGGMDLRFVDYSRTLLYIGCATCGETWTTKARSREVRDHVRAYPPATWAQMRERRTAYNREQRVRIP